MRATGIIRRIDDLGRIVLPREIRKEMGLSDGAPMELFIEKEGILLVPYYSSAECKIQALAQTILNEADELENEKNQEFVSTLAKTLINVCKQED